MEDKRISEKESLELIARMIRETQDNAARYAAYPLLIWGYTTVIVSLVVWYFYLQTGMWQINYLWFALPAIAGPLTIFFNGKDKNKGAKNYIDRVTAQIWTVFGVVGFCLSCMAFVVRIDILFVVSLLMGMGATLTGLVCKYKPLSIAGNHWYRPFFFHAFYSWKRSISGVCRYLYSDDDNPGAYNE